MRVIARGDHQREVSGVRRYGMFWKRWRLFRLCGIPVALDASWLIILALLTFSIASLFPTLMRQYFGEAAPDLPPSAYWLMGLIAAVAFFGCILLHELGHALVGRARGMPIRGITLFLFGGVAELEEEPPSAGTEFLMAIAGPVVSVLLGIGFALLTGIGAYAGWPPPVLMVLGYLAAINLLVLAFNLIPAFPLDGGRVLRSILWATTGDLRRATLWASRAGQAFRERAALAWTEMVTEVAHSHVPDDVYELARQHFGETELVDLTLAV